MNYMFSDSKSLNNLQYIDISNMTENELIKEKLSSLNSNTDLLICQTKNIVQDANNACCEFTKKHNRKGKRSKNKKMCYTNNYIIVQYGEKTEYPNGFGNQYRNGVAFINYNNKFYSKNESLTIEPNGTIEIHFGYAVKSLVVFFGYESNSDSGDKNVENIEFFVGDVENIFAKLLVEKSIMPDVVIVDPPRKGLDEETIQNLLALEPKKITYISCNPATLTRDIKMLNAKDSFTKSLSKRLQATKDKYLEMRNVDIFYNNIRTIFTPVNYFGIFFFFKNFV